MADKRTNTTQEERSLERTAPTSRPSSPFQMLQHFADEMDRVFDDFGFGRTRSRLPWRSGLVRQEIWSPDVEVFHRNSELIIRADLPGLNKDEVKVDVSDNAVSIDGERQRQHEEERDGVYRSERSYGRFHREIPLPEGVIADQAKATFKDGVLEITMPAPPEQARRGRRLEISEGTPGKR